MAIVTVRKAVRVLRDEGIVRTTPGWGTYFIDPGKRDESQAVSGDTRADAGACRLVIYGCRS
jgi:DNA-binding GntR family transcriptional regulator